MNDAQPNTDNIDLREALFNDGAIGNIKAIQVSTERVVSLRGILFDLDPHLYRISSILPVVPCDPHEFYATVARPWLNRHPVLRQAEIRNSGRGLHGILRFNDPVVFNTDADRKRWAGVVEAVQCALPIDPDQPGITAVTRPLGSINGKNGATVTMLDAGSPVSIEDVLALYQNMVASPFKTVMNIVIGSVKVKPCPICQSKDSELTALDLIGRCYGSCGKVKLAQLFDTVLAARATNHTEVNGNDAATK